MHPSRIADALDDRFRLLTGGSRTVMARQQTLEASVAWSHELLDEHERAVLRRFSVFSGGFTLDAAEAVAADELIDRFEVLDLLTRLVDKSLVQVDDDEHSRLSVPPARIDSSVRRERLVECRGYRRGPRASPCLLPRARRARRARAVSTGRTDLARAPRGRSRQLSAVRSSGPTRRAITSGSCDSSPRSRSSGSSAVISRSAAGGSRARSPRTTVASVARARALWGAAHVAIYGDDFETAMQRAPEALAMAEEVGDDWTTARALNTSGYAQLWFDPAGARDTLDDEHRARSRERRRLGRRRRSEDAQRHVVRPGRP